MDKRPIESSENNITKKCRIETPNPDETAVANDLVPATSSSIPSNLLLEHDMICKLPIELLDHIFQFLPLSERRNASLVCNKWHEIGSLQKYSLNEKLVFCGYENFERLLLFLAQTKREFLNLEFHDCKFHDSSNLLCISEKIRSLSFMDCALSDDFINQLFLKCDNLKEFNLFPTERYYTLGFLQPLVEKGFMNENLEILRLNVDGSHLSGEQIDALFSMFPSIKNLPFLELSRRIDYRAKFTDDYSFSLAQRIISKKHTLETLDIFGYENHLRLLESHNFSRLRRLSFLLRLENVPDTSYFNFIIQLEYLENLSLHMLTSQDNRFHNDAIVSTRYIVYLIRRCLHLKHLKLQSIDFTDLDFNPELFQALLSSNLISFEVDKTFLFYYSKVDECHQSPENRTLRVLRFQSWISHPVPTLFLQHFRNLKCVELVSLNDCEWESIAQFHKSLTSLKFSSRYAYQNGDVLPRQYGYQVLNCLRSLTNLESLHLKFEDFTLLFHCALVPPSVKYLRLSLSTTSMFGSENLKRSLLPLKNVKGLEAIYINSMSAALLDLDVWLEICSSLKKLRVLCLQAGDVHVGSQSSTPTNNDNQCHDTVEKLLECCPSLRCFVLKIGYMMALLFYDQVDGRMKKKRKVDPMMTGDFIFTEVIAGSKIKLNFPADLN